MLFNYILKVLLCIVSFIIPFLLSSWNELYFGKFFEAAAQEYYNRGNAALGLNRFNQSNW